MTQTISVNEALKLLQDGQALLIDVREEDEFAQEHIPYAVSIPLAKVAQTLTSLHIPADKILLFQCLKGTRGGMACQTISQIDTIPNKIMNIEGGIEAWKVLNLPVIGKSTCSKDGGCGKSSLSIFRQVQIIVGMLVVLGIALGFSGVTGGFIFAGILGAALCFAGITGWCGLAIILQKLPWNR